MRTRPKHGLFLVRFLTHHEALYLPGLVAINLVDGPGPFQMPARIEHRTCLRRTAEMFEQTLPAWLDDDEGGREKKHTKLEQNDPGQRLLKKLVEPCFGNFETELVIERLRRGGDQSARLAEQSGEPALVKQPRDLAFHSRPINFKDQTNQRFDGRESEHDDQSAGEVGVHLRETHPYRDLGQRG